MADILEYRAQPSAEFEFRDEGSDPIVEGYAATFMQKYPVGPFTEQIDHAAFNRSIGNKAEVPLLVDHEGSPLAHTKSGTMEIAPDSTGLHIRARLDPANPKALELISALRRGDLDKMSFAFRVPDGGDVWDDNYSLRTIREANIHDGDVSVVAYPANRGTSVGLRSANANIVQINAIFSEIRSGRVVSDDALLVLQKWADFLPTTQRKEQLPAPAALIEEIVTEPRATGHSIDFSKRVRDLLSL